MTSRALIFLALLAATSTALNYEYYVLAVEWAGTVCNFENCNATGTATKWFNIHGLWPTNQEGTGPSNCPGPEWDPSDISTTTQGELNVYWSGLYSSNNEFHDHEWSKHGVCWNDNVNGPNRIQDFFSTALSVAQQIDVYSTLAAAGFTPSANEYRTESIIEALSSAYAKFDIACQDGYLQTIQICLDLTYSPMDCPQLSNTCGTTVRYPVYSGSSIGLPEPATAQSLPELATTQSSTSESTTFLQIY